MAAGFPFLFVIHFYCEVSVALDRTSSGGFESGNRDTRTCAHNSRGPRFESRRLPWHAPICCGTRRPVEECPAVPPVGSEPKPRTQAVGRHFKKTTYRWLYSNEVYYSFFRAQPRYIDLTMRRGQKISGSALLYNVIQAR